MRAARALGGWGSGVVYEPRGRVYASRILQRVRLGCSAPGAEEGAPGAGTGLKEVDPKMWVSTANPTSLSSTRLGRRPRRSRGSAVIANDARIRAARFDPQLGNGQAHSSRAAFRGPYPCESHGHGEG